jgi:hypothetical protein
VLIKLQAGDSFLLDFYLPRFVFSNEVADCVLKQCMQVAACFGFGYLLQVGQYVAVQVQSVRLAAARLVVGLGVLFSRHRAIITAQALQGKRAVHVYIAALCAVMVGCVAACLFRLLSLPHCRLLVTGYVGLFVRWLVCGWYSQKNFCNFGKTVSMS